MAHRQSPLDSSSYRDPDMGAWVLFAKLCWQFDGLLVLIQDADLAMFVSEELNVTKIKSAALMEVTRSLTQSITHTHKHTYIQTQAHRHMQAHLYDFAHTPDPPVQKSGLT